MEIYINVELVNTYIQKCVKYRTQGHDTRLKFPYVSRTKSLPSSYYCTDVPAGTALGQKSVARSYGAKLHWGLIAWRR